MPLAPLATVQAEVVALVERLAPTRVPLRDALGRVLAEDVRAEEAVPPFANSGMDGYAVRAQDTSGATPTAPVRLRVVDELPAGRPATTEVGAGEAIRIMTGAVFPSGADAVVIVERTRRDGEHVLIEEPAALGAHRREAGGDVRPGDVVLTPGMVLGPPALGVLTALGRPDVLVVPPATVGVFSTGDELRSGGGVLEPGQIRDSNRPMLVGLVEEAGARPVDLGIVEDDEAKITALLEEAVATCDAVVTSGGVSMGDYDFVKAVLERMGVLQWRQVAIKPAKPLAFGRVGAVPVFGLPGNPVSSLVSFELFARPAIRTMMGYSGPERRLVVAEAGEDFVRGRDGKLHFDRVLVQRRGDRLVATRRGPQASNALSALAGANALALVPDGDGVATGAPIEVLPLGAAVL